MSAALTLLVGIQAIASASFTITTTATNWRILNVLQIFQTHGLSCEAAALQMSLAAFGIQRSQDTLLSQIGSDRRAPYWDSSGTMHWGDPYATFVGNVDGSGAGLTGYGVYYPPIANVAQADGATVSQSGEGIAPSTIYAAVQAGHPVIAWVSFDWRYHQVTHYIAFDGRTVQFGSPYEHAVVVRAVSPSKILINNPWFGVQWITKSTFESSYATFNHMAVIFGGPSVSSGMGTASATYNGATPVPQDTYHPLTPARVLDTRNGTGGVRGPVGAGGEVNFAITGQGGVPLSGADTVVLNVTVTNTTAAGYLTAYGSGQPRPPSSNLNWSAGETIANLVTVPIGANGMVTLFNAGSQSQLIADVEGWYGPAASPVNGGLYNSLAPSRLLDTRNTGGPIGGGQTRTLQVAGRGGVPATGVSAVVMNVTATDATSPSYLTVFPAGAARPVASNLNFVAGQQIPNRVIVPLGAGGQVSIFNGAGSVNVVVDVNGWFTDDTSTAGGSRFVTIPPQRILDTRYGFGQVLEASIQVTQLTDSSNIGVTALLANFTAVNAAAPSYLTVWPDGTTQPVASDLNYTTGVTIANAVIAKLGSNSAFDFYNYAGSSNIVVDLSGYYGPVGH